MRRGRLAAVAAVVVMAGVGWATGVVSAGGSAATISLSASATCDGTVSATYEYQLFAERSLSAGLLTFTVGVDKVNIALPDVPAELDAQFVTDTVTNGGYAVGDVVIVDITYTDSAEGPAIATDVVTIPQCPVTTDPPSTEATLDTEAPADTGAPATDASESPSVTETPDTDAAVDTEAPMETEAPTTDVPSVTEPPVEAAPSTLPSTGDGSLPTGLVAAMVLLAGVTLVMLAARRSRPA